MDFGLHRFFALILFLILPKNNVGVNVSCQALSFTRELSGELVPENLQFMLFYSNSLESVSELSSRHSCLDGSASVPQIQPCYPKNESQLWFQYQGSLINIKSGYSVIAADGSVTFGLWKNDSISLECEPSNPTSLISLSVPQNGSNIHYLGRKGSHEVILQSTSSRMWGIANVNGSVIDEYSLLCKKRSAFCGAITPGLNSVLISPSSQILNFLNVSETIVQRAFSTGIKMCYSGGDYILHACHIGYSAIEDSHRNYSFSVCLGDGLWSDPNPLDCVPVNCGKYPTFVNTVATSLSQLGKYSQYGDVVLYDCIGFYQGPQGRIACGHDGKWKGLMPKCKHICRAELTAESGVIKSPFYPSPYPYDIECRWTIRVKEGLRIGLFFLDFYLEYGSVFYSACRHDSLIIIDLFKEESNQRQYYCGSQNPDLWTSHGNIVELVFLSDDISNRRGFFIVYTAWNQSKSANPVLPSFNETFEISSDYGYGNEYASYTVEVVYVILVIILILLILLLVLSQLLFRVKRKISPTSDGLTPEERKRRLEEGRRNAIAQCTSELERKRELKNSSESPGEFSETFLRSMSSHVDAVKSVQKNMQTSRNMSLPEIGGLPTLPDLMSNNSQTSDLISEALSDIASVAKGNKSMISAKLQTILSSTEGFQEEGKLGNLSS